MSQNSFRFHVNFNFHFLIWSKFPGQIVKCIDFIGVDNSKKYCDLDTFLFNTYGLNFWSLTFKNIVDGDHSFSKFGTMKLIILLIVPLLFVFGEAFRLPHLDKTKKDPLDLPALFNSISTFINSIDTKPDSNLKHHLNTYYQKKIFASIFPNTFFLYVHFASKPRFPNNVSVPNFGLRMMWPIQYNHQRKIF